MNTPSPYSGVFRWAWHRARQYRAKFFTGAVAFSAVVSGISTFIVLPTNPTIGQKVAASAFALAGATILTGVVTYLWALSVAPLQQRNALRGELATARAEITALQAAPVSGEHGDRLRQIAAGLKRSAEPPLDALDYGIDPSTWRRAFMEHFPALRPLLELIDALDSARATFRCRLEGAAKVAGMDKAPWLLSDFIDPLAAVIQARSMQGILRGRFNFNWHESAGLAYVGDPHAGGVAIFALGGTTDAKELKRNFEEFMAAAEGWPEAANIRASWDLRSLLGGAIVPKLEVVANTDPISGRCFLCAGAS